MTEQPVITHLGMVRGEWPVLAFVSASHAAMWAADDDLRHVWPVEQIALGQPMKGRKIPQSYELLPEGSNL